MKSILYFSYLFFPAFLSRQPKVETSNTGFTTCLFGMGIKVNTKNDSTVIQHCHSTSIFISNLKATPAYKLPDN